MVTAALFILGKEDPGCKSFKPLRFAEIVVTTIFVPSVIIRMCLIGYNQKRPMEIPSYKKIYDLIEVYYNVTYAFATLIGIICLFQIEPECYRTPSYVNLNTLLILAGGF